MELRRIYNVVDNGKVTRFLRAAFGSYFFPAVTAAVSLLCYYLGWEVVNVWYLCICGTLIMICCKDVTPVICLFLNLNVLTSVQHCPSFLGVSSDYFVRPAILSQIIIAGAMWVTAVVWRTVTGIIKGRFKITPTFWGLLALCVAFMLSGSFYTQYTAMNFIYGLALSVFFLGFYCFAFGNIIIDGNTFKRLAVYVLSLFATVSVELIVAYITTEGLIVEGKVMRHLLFFGWGTYNYMGMLLCLGIPAWFYLTGKAKYGIGFLIGGLADVVLCFLSMSRQAMLTSVIVFAVCGVWILIWDKGSKRIINACIMACILAALTIALCIMHEEVSVFFSSFWAGLETGSGRTRLWNLGMKNFNHKPLFGVGFYDPKAVNGQPGFFGDSFTHLIPDMCHNTIIQILSACGLVGLVTYAIHRGQTIISYLNNPTAERTFLGLVLCTLLIASLLDNHIFYFFPTIFYSVMIAIMTLTEKDKKSRSLAAEPHRYI